MAMTDSPVPDTFDTRRFWGVLVVGILTSSVVFAAIGLFEMKPALLGGVIFSTWMFGLFITAKWMAGWHPTRRGV